ncbi:MULTISPECIES: sucrase ferredoxin [unclassified Actinopolyspora]|uniref:sucrase ferredoxin n=1 Tax=unclassified Actinopolyspora TaxID=2639451 RepID=UPI0013F62BF7|nr:sucrase ferredoxin [Actinopolyspora sp. BKK2]NHE77608.1 sucrase ferredoxin [Actinopolyspora sp. BKK1]
MQESQDSVGAAPSTCAAWSEALSEPMAGTAPVATSWLCLEQPGPWGRDALLQSHLDPELGNRLASLAAANGVRIQLIRRTGRHPDLGADFPRTVYLAHTTPGASWLRRAELTDPAQLLDLDLEGLSSGEHGGWGEPCADPVLLVCTNGRRDRCCALRGRELLERFTERHQGQLWETTHTGGHRFAPTGVVLPTGYSYARLTPHAVDAVLSDTAAGKVTTTHCRGRSALSQPAQVAELAVREATGERAEESLLVRAETSGEVVLEHLDGRSWRVPVEEVPLSPPRPNSCGKQAVEPSARLAGRISRLS